MAFVCEKRIIYIYVDTNEQASVTRNFTPRRKYVLDTLQLSVDGSFLAMETQSYAHDGMFTFFFDRICFLLFFAFRPPVYDKFAQILTTLNPLLAIAKTHTRHASVLPCRCSYSSLDVSPFLRRCGVVFFVLFFFLHHTSCVEYCCSQSRLSRQSTFNKTELKNTTYFVFALKSHTLDKSKLCEKGECCCCKHNNKTNKQTSKKRYTRGGHREKSCAR